MNPTQPLCQTHQVPLIVALLMATLAIARIASAQPVGVGKTYVVDQRSPVANDTNPGTAEAPFKTIGAAAKVVQPGDTVVIRSGVYRESVVIETNGTADKPIRFQPDVAANVVVTGADVLTDLTREPGEANVFSAPWPYVFIGWNKSRAHPDDDFHRAIGRAEQVFGNG